MLLKDKNIGRNIVPIVPDEARTFGMEGLFRQIGIYSSVGQLYTPQDAETLMSYREDKKGQMIEEGINEAGSLCSWMAAGTAYSNHGINMVPFYIFYSMFGFQRVGDFIWAAGDIQSRGFLLGATAGRTTLAGEGLQHQDGHSQLVATTVPNCVAYDPAYAYELAVIIHDGTAAHVRRAGEHLLLPHRDERELPAAGACRRGCSRASSTVRTCCRSAAAAKCARRCSAREPSCASAWRRRSILEDDYRIPADVLSVTSFIELRREALECERWNLLHPGDTPHVPYVRQLLKDREGPVIAATDYMRAVPDQIRQWVGAATSPSVPTATAGPTRAPRCAGTSRSIATTSWSPRSRRSPTRNASTARRSPAPSRRSASIQPSPSPGRSEGRCHERGRGCGGSTRARSGQLQGRRRHRRLVKPGDSISVDTPLVTLESDKAAMEVPSTASGVVEKIHTAKGGKVYSGDLLATLKPAAGAPASAPTAAAAPPAPAVVSAPPAAAPAPVQSAGRTPAPAAPDSAQPAGKLVSFSQLGTPSSYRPDLPAIDEPGFSRAHAGPSVRKFARELGVDLARVTGQGFKGRITHDDVKAFVKRALAAPAPPAAAGAASARPALPAIPAVDYSQFGPVETQPLTRIQTISGPRLQAAWVNIPHVTQFDEADITELEELRASLKDKAQAAGVKLTPLAFIMRACVKTLHEFPRFNAALDADGANLIVRKFIHIGFAADTPGGLVVPVVKDAHRKDVYELARAAGAALREGTLRQAPAARHAGRLLHHLEPRRYRRHRLHAHHQRARGGDPRRVALDACKPVYRGANLVPRLMLPLSLSYDHRVIDGAMAARFTTYLAQTLAEPRSLLEAVL